MRAPTGTVTLVFTDVQGSTALWEADAALAEAALSVHNATLRALLDDHGGYEVKTEGDAFMVAFSRPDAAARWCVAAQQALVSADWPAGLDALPQAAPAEGFRGLRVRMGGHLGAPRCLADPVTGRMDYFGPVVNRAARVGGCGHGGQIVASRAWVEAAGPVPGARAVPLGRYGLRGLRAPEALVAWVPDALAVRRFPPLRATPEQRRPLPPAPADRVGRDAELAAATAALEAGAPVVTLRGPGGAGKTHLAACLVHARLAEAAPEGGAAWVDLTPTRTAEAVARALADALGAPVGPDGLPVALADRGALLVVLDNAEQVAAPVADLLTRLHAAAPRVQAVVTSRLRLGLDAEHEVEVGALDEADALRLLELRAGAAAPGIALEADRAPDARALVRQLDGSPLAIELAAARLSSMPLARMLERMDQRFQLLSRRGEGGRQATLEATLGWSWDLLAPHARRVLAALTAFSGPFTAADADAVLDLPEDAPWVEDTLDDLHGHSLLWREVVQGAPGFRLSESTRAFARARRAETLGPEAEAALRTGHARWAARWGVLGERWTDAVARHADLARTVPQRRGDLSRALDHALDVGDGALAARVALGLAHLHLEYGPPAGGVALVTTTLQADGIPPRDRAELLLALATLQGRTGDRAGGQATLAALPPETLGPHGALRVGLSRGTLSREAGDVEGFLATIDALAHQVGPTTPTTLRAHVENQRGIAASHRARYAEGEQHFRHAVALYREVGMERSRAAVALNLGGDLATRGRVAEARRCFDDALRGARAAGDHRFHAFALLNVALLDYRHGSLEDAWEGLVEAERTATEAGDARARWMARLHQGCCQRSQGQLVAAAHAIEEAVAGLAAADSRYWVAVARMDLSDVHLRLGDLARAEALLEDSAAFFASQDDPGGQARAAVHRARLAVWREEEGPHDAALQAARQAALDTEQVLEAAEALSQLARLAWRRGDLHLAEQRYEAARAECALAELWATWTAVTANLGILHAGGEQPDRGRALLEEALATARRIAHRPLQATCMGNLAEARIQAGDLDGAADLMVEAAQRYDELGFRARAGGVRRAQAALAIERGRVVEARAFARRALEEAGAAGAPVGEVQALCLLARIDQQSWDFDAAHQWLSRARSRAHAAGIEGHPSVQAALQGAVEV